MAGPRARAAWAALRQTLNALFTSKGTKPCAAERSPSLPPARRLRAASLRVRRDLADRPVKLILAHPAGSGVDNVARVVADRMSRGWGQQVVIENKPGGQNLIGAQYAARSPADGYNFYFANSAALVTNVYLFKALPYDPQKDFVPVGLIGRSPFAILVEDKSPLHSIADLLARPAHNRAA